MKWCLPLGARSTGDPVQLSGSGGGSGPISYEQEPVKMAPRSFSGPISQMQDNYSAGPILQMNSSIEAHHQPVLASPPENLFLGRISGLTGLALGPPQSSMTASSSGLASLAPLAPLPPVAPALTNVSSAASDWQQLRSRDFRKQESFGRMFPPEEFPTEDELRARSLELLENEDMHTQIQQLLRMYNGQVGDIPFSPYGPIPGEDTFLGLPDEEAVGEHKPRPNGKAYVGWLKLKAALHWGIFIRKRAAARRAQLEELDEES